MLTRRAWVSWSRRCARAARLNCRARPPSSALAVLPTKLGVRMVCPFAVLGTYRHAARTVGVSLSDIDFDFDFDFVDVFFCPRYRTAWSADSDRAAQELGGHPEPAPAEDAPQPAAAEPDVSWLGCTPNAPVGHKRWGREREKRRG